MSSQIKYCLLTTIAGSLRSFVLPLAYALAGKGMTVIVGCKDDGKIASELPGSIRFLPIRIERGFHLVYTVLCIVQLRRFFRRERIDVVEYGTENVSFCASVAAWLARVPVRIYNHWGPRYIGYSGVLRLVSFWIERSASFFSTDIREQSRKNLEMCVKDKVYPLAKVKVVGYGGTVGVDFAKYDMANKSAFRREFRRKAGIPETDFVFGDVGYFRRDKGSGELIRAFKNMSLPDAWLVFVGDVYEEDPVDPELNDWAKASSHVVFTGRVPDVEHYLSGFDCMVHPTYREGFGMVLQEAGALGVPCITTDIPGPSEFGVDGESVLLVRKADAGDLESKMSLLYHDRALLSSLSENIYRLVSDRYERNIMVGRHLEDRIAILNRQQKGNEHAV